MKRPIFYLLVSLASFIVGIIAASSLILLETPNIDEIAVTNEQSLQIEEEPLGRSEQRYTGPSSISYVVKEPGFARFRNVSFRYDPKVFSHARIEEVLEDSPLEFETDKPGEDFPKHIVFHLKWREKEATIRILPIADYRRMYSVSEGYTDSFNRRLEGIRKATDDRHFRLNEEMPFIPYYDATQEFQEKVKPMPFRTGKGFFFLTEYTIEPTIINNEQLRYFYQGISGDGRYYVLGEFHVSAPFLPDERYSDSFEGYVLPGYFYLPETRESNERKYAEYTSKIAGRLRRLQDDRFQPSLGTIRDVISSLDIQD